MKITELHQPIIGDIVEFETDPDTVVEGRIIAETEDGYIYEFSENGFTELSEACAYGKYFCSTDKVWKCRQGPKQSRKVSEEEKEDPCWDGYHMVGMKNKGGKKVPNCVPEASNPAQQAAIAIAKKKKKQGVSEEIDHKELMKQGIIHPVIAGDMDTDTSHNSHDYHEPKTGKLCQGKCVHNDGKEVHMRQHGTGIIHKFKVKNSLDEDRTETKDKDGNVTSWRDEGEWEPTNPKKNPQGKVHNLTGQALKKTKELPTLDSDNVASPVGSGVAEADYHGRDVPLGKPMKGDVKKSKVYVRNAKGDVVKVNFGDPNMRIKKNSPAHRKSFRARHHCDNPGPRWKANYWSCRAW